MDDAVQYINVDDQVSAEMRERISGLLDECKQHASEELDNLCKDQSQQPITYNHYYTDNIENARRNTARNWVKSAMRDAAVEGLQRKAPHQQHCRGRRQAVECSATPGSR